jgi:acyl-CoA thioesterase-2
MQTHDQTHDPAVDPVEALLAQLDLERIEDNLFRGHSPDPGWGRIFGGLVVAQSLVAAERTVEARAPHSLHCYFLVGGDPKVPIIYQVERVRDGASFSTRRVVAVQHGRPIFVLSASFQIEEPGFEHAVPRPDAPDPDSLPSQAELAARYGAMLPPNVRDWLSRPRPMDVRMTDLSRMLGGAPPNEAKQAIWIRAARRLPDDPAIHRAALAYFSDLTLLDASLIPHGKSVFSKSVQCASLDHALWLHRPFRADEWLLYSQTSPSASGARGFNLGQFHDREGRLVASVAQEGLIRPVAPKQGA